MLLGTVLCTVGPSAASLASTVRCQQHAHKAPTRAHTHLSGVSYQTGGARGLICTTDLHPNPTGLSQSQGNQGYKVLSELPQGTTARATKSRSKKLSNSVRTSSVTNHLSPSHLFFAFLNFFHIHLEFSHKQLNTCLIILTSIHYNI